MKNNRKNNKDIRDVNRLKSKLASKKSTKKKIKGESFYLQQYSPQHCENKIVEMQIEIYKNIKKENTKKVFTIQKYLVKSKEACFLAVRGVITNNGGRTPGIDEYIPTTRVEYEYLIQKLMNIKPDTYECLPLKRIWIPKAFPSKDLRLISIPTIFDRCVQAVWSLALDPVNEAFSDKHNFGFRKGRSPKEGMAYVFRILNAGRVKGTPSGTSEAKIFAKIYRVVRDFTKPRIMLAEGVPQ